MIRSLIPADWQALTQAAVWTLEQYRHSKQTELNREELRDSISADGST